MGHGVIHSDACGISTQVIRNVFQFSIEESACFIILVAFKTLFAANNYEVVFGP